MMRKHFWSKGITALVFLGFVLVPAFPELSPQVYADYQADAPEFIELTVLRVQKPLLSLSRTVTVRLTARVERVHRSASRLNPGDEITISYEHYRPPRGWVGPRPIPVLARGAGYPAYLSWDSEDRLYRPAARGWSFETTPISP